MNPIDVGIAVVAILGLLALALVATYHIGKAQGAYEAERAAVKTMGAWNTTLDRYSRHLSASFIALQQYHAAVIRMAAEHGVKHAPPEIPGPVPTKGSFH